MQPQMDNRGIRHRIFDFRPANLHIGRPKTRRYARLVRQTARPAPSNPRRHSLGGRSHYLLLRLIRKLQPARPAYVDFISDSHSIFGPTPEQALFLNTTPAEFVII